jgi:hypothetical protein
MCRLSLPTTKTFLRRTMHREQQAGKVDKALYFLAGYLAEQTLLERCMLALLPSQVAASAYVWALVLLRRPVDQANVAAVTGYNLPDLAEALRAMRELHTLVSTASQRCAVWAKYAAPAYSSVALVPPVTHTQLMAMAVAGGAACGTGEQQQHKQQFGGGSINMSGGVAGSQSMATPCYVAAGSSVHGVGMCRADSGASSHPHQLLMHVASHGQHGCEQQHMRVGNGAPMGPVAACPLLPAW